MIPSNLGPSTVYLKTSTDLPTSFSVEFSKYISNHLLGSFSSDSQVCVLEKESDICESATYISRTHEDGSRIHLVAFQAGVFTTIEQKFTLSPVEDARRLLQSSFPDFAVFGATDARIAHLAPTGKVTGRDEKVITVYTTTSRKAPDLVSKVFVDEYEPSTVENTVLSGAKILGVDQSVWYVLTTTDKKRFMIVTDGTHHPAQLYQDGGKTVVNILSAAARRHPKLANVFATVVFADDSYLNIEDSFWNEIKKLPEILFSSALPKAAYISAGIINQHGQLYGTQLNGLVVEVEADGAYESLFTLSGPKGQAKGTIQTSAKGYKTFSFTDDSGNKDSYVICTYALNWMISNAKYTPNLPGYSEAISPPDLRKLLLSNEEGLRSLVREVAHVTPSVFLIDTFHNAQRSFVIRSASKQAKEFSGSELESIYLKGVSTRLSHVWFNQVSIKQAKTAIVKGSDVLKLDQSYLKLKIETFLQLIDAPDASAFEPQLNGVTNNQKVKDDLGLDKITLTNEVKQAIFKEGRNYVGLFVKATKPWANKFAPSVVVKEQGSLQRYYFEMDQIRAALGLEGTSPSDVKDKRTPELFDKYRPKILAQSLCPTRATPSVAVLFRGMRKWLGEECLIALKSLEIPQALTSENMCIAQLQPEGVQYYVRIENRYYKLDFDLVEEALREDKFSAGKSSRDKVYKCLDIEIVQSDPKVLRAIPINSTDVMQGRCNGNFVPNFSCNGIWTGNHTRGHACKLASLDRCHKYYDFVCEGKLTSKSCEGAYKRNAVVNTTELAVQSKKASVNIQRAIITGSVQLGASSQESQIDVKCDTGYDVQNKKCSLASVHTETLEKGVHTRLTVTCKGILNIETHECNMGQYDVFICSQINNKFGGEQCNGTLRKIHCENGGTLRGCAVQSPGNVDINCYGGFWDGKYCKLFPKYIITTSKHQYYTGDCQGEFEQNHFCKGLFIGTVVECPGVELKDNTNLCELPAISNFICRGILTNKGCRGYLKTTVLVQRRKFETSITAELEPITHDYISEDSLTKMKVIPTNDSNSEEWRIRCAKSFNYVKKTCQDAVYAHDVKTSTGIINREYYVCKGTLNLESLRCSDDLYSVHRCTTKFADKRFPQFCNGTYEGLLCATGGTPTDCLQDDFTNVELSCVEGIWNGYSCLERPMHIILNNAAYVTGTCDGVYIENYKCKGKLEAQVILCPPGVTSDKLCKGAVVDSFTCQGLFTKEGCEGLYSGHTSLGNASLQIISHSPIAITVNKKTSHPVALDTREQFTLYPEVGPAGQWFGVQAVCGDGFSEGANECRKTEFQGVKIADNGERIFYSVKCAGAFDMERLHCASGIFNGISCQTASHFQSNACEGTFKNLTCANGGNFSSNCLHNEASDKVINCVGIFDGENCTAIKIEYFPIVHVSRNIWLKGTCSQKMTTGECRGIFDRA